MYRVGNKLKERISLIVLTVVYLLFHYRYAPGRIVESLVETMFQLLTTAPVVVGLTILLVSFLQRMYGERLPWDRIVRIYLTFGIILGFLYGLNEYWLKGSQGP